MEVSEPKWVNPNLNIIGINSLRLGDLHIAKTIFSNIKKNMNLKIQLRKLYKKQMLKFDLKVNVIKRI